MIGKVIIIIKNILSGIPIYFWYIAVGLTAVLLYSYTRELLLSQTVWIKTISTAATVNVAIMLFMYVIFYKILLKAVGTLKGSLLWFSGLACITLALLVARGLI